MRPIARSRAEHAPGIGPRPHLRLRQHRLRRHPAHPRRRSRSPRPPVRRLRSRQLTVAASTPIAARAVADPDPGAGWAGLVPVAAAGRRCRRGAGGRHVRRRAGGRPPDQPGAGRRAVAVQHGRSRPVDVAADGRHGRPGARRDARSGARGRRRVVPRHARPARDRRADGLGSPRGRRRDADARPERSGLPGQPGHAASRSSRSSLDGMAACYGTEDVVITGDLSCDPAP